MKIVCIFGENNVLSRNRYYEIISGVKKKGFSHIVLDPAKKLSEQIVASSLFREEILYTTDHPQKIPQKELIWLGARYLDFDGKILMYFSKNIPAVLKKSLPKSTLYEEFKKQSLLFTFTDALFPKNGKSLILTLNKLKREEEPEELVLHMIYLQIKNLILVKLGSINLPSWKIRKLQTQASKWTFPELNKFLFDLSDIDLKVKTGAGSFWMLLDLLIVKELY